MRQLATVVVTQTAVSTDFSTAQPDLVIYSAAGPPIAV
jgi:hypothetical protein